MTELWQATPQRPVILNLPATVEVATPNVYADQIEYMHTHLARRDAVILSVHPHNDRGTGVACAELAVLAGAQRVEGCLFGNGERTGNVDLVTLALNLHAQGVDPMIDFSDIDEVRRVVEHCNRLEVSPRHPYVGDLVHTAFSGTHQDAIRKGFAEHRARAAAEAQSGKGGIAYLLETEYGLELPRRVQIDLSHRVQQHTDRTGDEVSAADIWAIFAEAYLSGPEGAVRVSSLRVGAGAEATVTVDGTAHHGVSETGPVDALVRALADAGLELQVLSVHQSSLRAGADAETLTLVEYRSPVGSAWAAGRDASVLSATANAVIRAANATAAARAMAGAR
ncbi:MAG: isopropylmalate/homocitrate/citramalate synthase [Microbacterium sp.]|nr:isopropylmalate/homocitrate/citramalate synthase [Microbacterium sp.]